MVNLSDLEYNRFKAIVSVLPVQKYPFWDFRVLIKNSFDWYEDSENFIPCFKTIGKFSETLIVEERSQKFNQIKNDYEVKKIPKKYKNKFIIGETKFPSFYGYFSAIEYFNKEYRKLKKFIIETILKREQIYDEELVEKINSFELSES